MKQVNEATIVAESILEAMRALDRDLVGEVTLEGECVFALDRRLRVMPAVHYDEEAHPSIAHVHVTSEIAGDKGTQAFEACVVGIHEERAEALADAARTWMQQAAPAILSLMHAREVLDAEYFSGKEIWGVRGVYGFVGPLAARFVGKEMDMDAVAMSPLFEYAPALVPPGVSHIAKVTLNADGQGGWTRSLEIDGHAASHADPHWESGPMAPTEPVICTRFAVFHYADQPDFVRARQTLDDAIRAFVKVFQQDPEAGSAAAERFLVEHGVAADVADRVRVFAPMAFARLFLAELGARLPDDYTRISAEGELIEGLRLMNEPAFARSSVLAREFASTHELVEGLQRAAMFSSEAQVLNDALLAKQDPKKLSLLPSLVPDPGVSDETLQWAIKMLEARAQEEASKPAKRRKKDAVRFWK